jgi:hypothetical protein
MSLMASAYPLLHFELDKFLLEFQQQNRLAEAGVGVEGPGATYALVWEWGSARISKPGPKTVWGTNPDGKRVVLSLQAPRGYIRVNEPLYWAALEQEMGKVDFSGTTTQQIRAALEKAAVKVAERMVKIIQEHVPVDTGELHDDIRVIRPGDELLDEAEEQNALVLTGG